MVYTVPHFIEGKAYIDSSLPSLPITNPTLGEAIGQIYIANQHVCEQAIASAQRALPAWAEAPPVKRLKILFSFLDLLKKDQKNLAHLVSNEHGKTLEDAQGSIARAIEVVEYHCGLITQLQGSFSSNVSSEIDCYTQRQPLGVCVGISPFNFPVMVPIWMMIPAIFCGNTFILKPSEQAPSAPIRLLELLTQAGLPTGVANCVQGDKSTVEQLLMQPAVAAYTAVASTPVAEFIYKTATAAGKRAHTFGGAKNHAVVMPDAHLDYTANAIVGAAFGSAGERCMALSVVVAVGKDTADALLEKMKPLIHSIRIDAPDVPGCDMGPLISSAHRQRIIAAVTKGVEEGAELIIDGRDYQHPRFTQGYFLGPSLFDRVQENMFIYQQELFGPVLLMLRVTNFEQALALVNRNQYGNGTAIFTQDGYTAREYSQRVQVGMVGINIPIPVPIAHHPFGGWKRSSFGDTNMHGAESIQFYTRRKTITSRWPTTTITERGFVMPTHN